MSKVIHEAKPARYVIEYRDSDWETFDGQTWEAWASFEDVEAAVAEADRLAAKNPRGSYRVIDTKE